MTIRYLNQILRKQANIDQIRAYHKDGTAPTNKVLDENLLKQFRMDGDDLVYKEEELTVVVPDDKEEVLQEEYDDLVKSAGMGIKAFYKSVADHYLGITRADVGVF